MSTPVRRALYGKMSGDTTLNNLLKTGTPPVSTAAPGYTKAIYHGVAPEGAGFPYVLFHRQSGTPTDANGYGVLSVGDALEDVDVWLIKGVDRAPSADKAEAIADRLNELLNDGALSGMSGTGSQPMLVYLRRESDVDYGEVIEGVQYRHAGALYRLIYT